MSDEDPPVADDALREPDARLIATDRTVRPELVAIVRAAGPAAECTRRSTATDWERCGWCPACRLAVRLDALRTKTEGRDVDVAIAAALERVRLEAIEACIAAATSVRDGWRERGMLSAPAAAAWCMAIDAVATRLRSMLDAPAPADPATCAHDREVLGGTCSDCAAPIAVNGHRPGCHASGLGPPMRIGDGGFTGCGCPPTPDTRT